MSTFVESRISFKSSLYTIIKTKNAIIEALWVKDQREDSLFKRKIAIFNLGDVENIIQYTQ